MTLHSDEVLLRVCRDDRSSAYIFRCPRCRLIVSKAANPYVVSLLEQGGVRREDWSLPLELAEDHFVGEPLSYDDIIDLHAFLETDDWQGKL